MRIKKNTALGSRYRLLRRLGLGAMGEVWRAEDRKTRNHVAAKLLHPHLATDPEVVSRFVQERTILLALHHPRLVAIRDLVAEGESLAIVMDLVEGSNLDREIQACRTFTVRRATSVVGDIAAALSAVHQGGVVHRDVKPANILLDNTGKAFLADFGIARMVASPRLTQHRGITVGTPAYLAPELVRGTQSPDPDDIGPACDLYSLGVVLYQMITGRLPFGESSVRSLLNSQIQYEPEAIENCPPALSDVLNACLAKSSSNRPTAEELVAVLTPFANTDTEHDIYVVPPRRARDDRDLAARDPDDQTTKTSLRIAAHDFGITDGWNAHHQKQRSPPLGHIRNLPPLIRGALVGATIVVTMTAVVIGKGLLTGSSSSRQSPLAVPVTHILPATSTPLSLTANQLQDVFRNIPGFSYAPLSTQQKDQISSGLTAVQSAHAVVSATDGRQLVKGGQTIGFLLAYALAPAAQSELAFKDHLVNAVAPDATATSIGEHVIYRWSADIGVDVHIGHGAAFYLNGVGVFVLCTSQDDLDTLISAALPQA